MSNSFENFDYSHSALANAQDEFTAAFIIFQMTIEQLKVVDDLANTTQSIRAIAQSHLMRKDVLAMTADLQRYISYSALKESGVWQEQMSGDNATEFHISCINRTK